MWFSPLKGAHLTLGQVDKTLPVDLTVPADEKSTNPNTKIERGSFVYIKADEKGTPIPPCFALYTAAEAAKPNAVPYIALMGVDDFQAGMAGNIGQAEEAQDIAKKPVAAGKNLTFLDVAHIKDEQTFRGPRITAISVLQAAEYQTSAFEEKTSEKADITYYVGQPLTVSANGKLEPWTTGKNTVGYVTAVPFVRWINDLGASKNAARISGGNAKVINFSTAWIPTSGTPAPLAVGKPSVVTTQAAGAAAGAGSTKPDHAK